MTQLSYQPGLTHAENVSYAVKQWVVLTHFGYLSLILFSMSLNNFYSPMTFTNDLENQIKFLICLESKAGSGTSLCLMMQTIKIESKQPLHFYSELVRNL